MKHFDRQLTDILDEKLKYPLKSDGNILIGGCDNVMRMKMHGARKIGQRGVFGRTAVREVPDS